MRRINPLSMQDSYKTNPWYVTAAVLSSALFILYLTTFYNYVLFHTLAEWFAIIVAGGIFMVAWNTRQFMRNNYFLFIGIALLFIALIDVLHTLSYKGLGVFVDFDANLPTQMWIAGRYLQAVSFIIAPIFLGRKLRSNLVVIVYAIITALILLSIFYWKIFPDAFIEGKGLAQFKINSEYIISLLFLFSAGTLIWTHRYFDTRVLNFLVASIGVTVLSELFFTTYISVYGFSNMVGHFLRIISFFLLYKAVIETGLRRPYNLLFWELKGSENRYRSVTESANDAIISADTNGKIISWNRGAEIIFGYSEEEAMGKPLTLIMPDEYQQKHQQGMQRVKTTRKLRVSGKTLEVEGLTKAGAKVPLELSLSSWVLGRRMYFTGIIRDISERKELEKRKDEFISIASHELKTPITALMGFSEILSYELKKKSIAKASIYLNRMSEQMRNLSMLVSDLLDVTRINAGRLELNRESFSLDKLIDETIDNLYMNCAGHEIFFAGNKVESKVFADRHRISQVLTNLILNAIKYSPGKEKVIVRVRKDKNFVKVSVTDFGIGIAKKEHKKIMQSFYRAENVSKGQFAGAGLGLHIAVKIIERHKGKLWLDSELGKGSTFYFT